MAASSNSSGLMTKLIVFGGILLIPVLPSVMFAILPPLPEPMAPGENYNCTVESISEPGDDYSSVKTDCGRVTVLATYSTELEVGSAYDFNVTKLDYYRVGVPRSE